MTIEALREAFMRLTESGEKSSLFFYFVSRAKLRSVLRVLFPGRRKNKNIFKNLRKIVDNAIYIWYNIIRKKKGRADANGLQW